METENRKVRVQENPYKDSPIFCNLHLTSERSAEVMGFTRKEAEEVYFKLGVALQNHIEFFKDKIDAKLGVPDEFNTQLGVALK